MSTPTRAQARPVRLVGALALVANEHVWRRLARAVGAEGRLAGRS